MDWSNRHEASPDGGSFRNRVQAPTLLSTRGAILTIIKCAIGAGSFSLPRAFKDGGVYISFLTTLFLGILSAYTLLLLVDSSTISSLLTKCKVERDKDRFNIELTVVAKETRPQFLGFNYKPLAEVSRIEPMVASEVFAPVHCSTYPEMGAVAFPEVTFTFRGSKYNLAYIIITIGILLTSLGVCAAYVDFIAGTLPEVIRGWSKNRHVFLTINNTPWIIMPIILGFSFLRTMKVLTYTSFLGNLLVLIGCFVVIVLGIIRYHSTVTLDHNFVEWKTLPRYVGGNTFFFAIHVVILPLMQQMENQSGNKNKRDAISRSYAFITLFNATFGSVGFLLFASSTCTNDQATPYTGPCDNILSSISGGNLLDFVKVLVSVDLLFTIPLILAASRAVIEDGILNSALIRDGRRKWLNRYRKKCDSANASDGHELNATGFNLQLNETLSPLPKPSLCAFDADACPGEAGIPYDVNQSPKVTTNEELKDDRGSDADFTVIDFNTETVTDNPILNRRVDSQVNYDDERLHTGIKMAQELLLRNERFTLFVQYTVRTSLVMTVILMAVLIPGFGDMVDLVGGVVCSFTGFFLPPIIYMRLRSKLFHLQLPADSSTSIAGLTHSIKKKSNNSTNDLGSIITANLGTLTPETPGTIMVSGEGVAYIEKQPMSCTFLILHFLITIFGLLTMVTTVIVTAVNTVSTN